MSDFEGNYSFLINEGKRNLTISYVGYEKLSYSFTVGSKNQRIDFKMKTLLLNEVQVVSDVAIDRDSHGFSTIPMKKINEELASQDIPMVLNSTPGVYATQGGGGDGDAGMQLEALIKEMLL